MKFQVALILSTLMALSSAQTIKERLVEHRANQFDGNDSTLEAIKENHVRRMAKLEEMIEDRRRLVADHESGRRKLDEEEFDKAARQFRNFQRKLEQMKNQNDEEHHLERLDELKSLHNMNRIDYVDFKENLRGPN